MKEMIKMYNCLNCDEEINSESETVFCNQECLDTYIEDVRDLNLYLHKHRYKKNSVSTKRK